jgi:hypothetical protein
MTGRLSLQPLQRAGSYVVPGMALLLALEATLLYGLHGTESHFLMLVCMSLIVIGTGLLRDENGQLNIRQPWSVLLVLHIPFWVIGSWGLVRHREQQDALIRGAAEQIDLALFVVSLGFFCIALGYEIGLRFNQRPRQAFAPAPWNLSRLVMLGLVTYSICWYIRINWYFSSLCRPYYEWMMLPPVSAVSRIGSTILPNALLVGAWLIAFHERKRKDLYVLCWVLTVAEIGWGFLYGVMKSLLFMPIFLPTIPYILLRNRIPLLRISLGAALLVLIAYPYVEEVRDRYFHQDGPARLDAIKSVFQERPDWYKPNQAKVSLYSERAVDRVSGLSSICQILQLDKDGRLGDIKGEFYKRAVLGLIPRFLWSGKPIIHEGTYFSAYLDGAQGLNSIDLSIVTGSVATTLFGSFFWNLGWPGLVITSFALGLFSGIGYRIIIARGMAYPSTIFYYMAILASLETTETEVAKLPSSLLAGLVVAWVADRMLSMKQVPGLVRRQGESRGLTSGQPENAQRVRRSRFRERSRPSNKRSAPANRVAPDLQ